LWPIRSIHTNGGGLWWCVSQRRSGRAISPAAKVGSSSAAVLLPEAILTPHGSRAPGTNPEELLGAAEAGCFSMALSLGLTRIGHPPKSIHTTARVHLERFVNGFAIDQIELETVAEVPGLDPGIFREQVALAKHGCPVSKALSGTKIGIKATLNGE
jgi:osmotically inducible protein OsmC